MRTEKQLREQIEAEKVAILNSIMQGTFENYSLIEHKCWINALDWVLGDK